MDFLIQFGVTGFNPQKIAMSARLKPPFVSFGRLLTKRKRNPEPSITQRFHPANHLFDENSVVLSPAFSGLQDDGTVIHFKRLTGTGQNFFRRHGIPRQVWIPATDSAVVAVF